MAMQANLPYMVYLIARAILVICSAESKIIVDIKTVQYSVAIVVVVLTCKPTSKSGGLFRKQLKSASDTPAAQSMQSQLK